MRIQFCVAALAAFSLAALPAAAACKKDGKNVWKLKEDCEFTTKKGKKVTMHKGHWVGPKICEQCVKGDWSLIGKAKSKGEKAKDKE